MKFRLIDVDFFWCLRLTMEVILKFEENDFPETTLDDKKSNIPSFIGISDESDTCIPLIPPVDAEVAEESPFNSEMKRKPFDSENAQLLIRNEFFSLSEFTSVFPTRLQNPQPNQDSLHSFPPRSATTVSSVYSKIQNRLNMLREEQQIIEMPMEEKLKDMLREDQPQRSSVTENSVPKKKNRKEKKRQSEPKVFPQPPRSAATVSSVHSKIRNRLNMLKGEKKLTDLPHNIRRF